MKELCYALAGIFVCVLVAGLSGCGGGGGGKITPQLSYETVVNRNSMGYVDSFDITLNNSSEVSKAISIRSETFKNEVILHVDDRTSGDTSTFSYKGLISSYGQEVDSAMYWDGAKWIRIPADPRTGVPLTLDPRGQLKIRLGLSKG